MRARDERGAVTILVALIVCFVVVPFAALVVDLGMMRVARSDMQAVADMTALNMAHDLASGVTPTAALGASSAGGTTGSIGSPPTVAVYLGYISPSAAFISNQSRGCGTSPYDAYFAAVPTGATANAVLVTATTTVGFVFHPGSGTVCRSAVAAETNAGGGTGMALTVSLCNWDAATNNGTTFAQSPPFSTWPPPGVPGYSGVAPAAGTPGGEQVLSFHGWGNDCSGSPSGWQLPGGFGWLGDPAGNCQVHINVQSTYIANPGNSADAACETIFDNSYLNHTPIFIPVYDGTTGTDTNATYHLKGWAEFVITGVYMHGQGPSDDRPSSITGRQYCSGSLNMCLYGVFTQGLITNPTPCPTIGGCLPGGWATRLAG